MVEECRCVLLIPAYLIKPTCLRPPKKLVDRWQENLFVACSFPIIPSYLHTVVTYFWCCTHAALAPLSPTRLVWWLVPLVYRTTCRPLLFCLQVIHGVCATTYPILVWGGWKSPRGNDGIIPPQGLIASFYSPPLLFRCRWPPLRRSCGGIDHDGILKVSFATLPHEEEIQLIKERKHQRQQAPPATSNNHKWKLYVAVVCSRSHDSSTDATGYGWRGQSRGRLSTVFWVKSFTHVL